MIVSGPTPASGSSPDSSRLKCTSLIVSLHPKGRNRKQAIDLLCRMGVITPEQRESDEQILSYRKLQPDQAVAIEIGRHPRPPDLFHLTIRAPSGERIDLGHRLAATSGARITALTQLVNCGRFGADGDHTQDLRRIPLLVEGQFDNLAVKIFSATSLANALWLKGAMAYMSHLTRRDKIFLQGFDTLLPVLDEAELLKSVPTRLEEYERCRSRNNPFRIIGRFLEAGNDLTQHSKFSLLMRGEPLAPENLPRSLLGKKVGVREEDRPLAQLLFRHYGVQCELVQITEPEMVLDSKRITVDYSLAHVTSGRSAKQYNLSWTPLLYSSQVVLVHRDALRNRAVIQFVNAMKATGQVV